VGIQGGFYSLGVDFSALRPRDKDDVLLYSGDLSQVRRDFGLGLQITKKKYYIGIAANHIFQPAFAFGATTSSKLNIHTNITGGMNFDLSNDIAIKPSAIIRTDFNSFSAQVSAIASYQNFINFGLGMRNSFGVDDAILFAGINLLKDKSLHIGYAFDYVVSGVSAKAPTSHEVMVRYNIPMPISIAPIIRTPRFRF
jgi:type IX secretion system PorP/SprF family membrane protein